MNNSDAQSHRHSPFTRPVFWIAFAVVSLGCAVFAFSNADRAFSFIELELRMDRAAALSESRQLAESLELGPTGSRQAASFRVDDRARSFVELEGGGPAVFGELIGEGPYRPYQWVVRHFREGDPHELEVRFLPDGTPYGFREQLSEDTPGPALETDAAQAIAEAGVGAPWDVDLTVYELVESSRTERPSERVDHTFTYEHAVRQAGEGRYRLNLTVSGDRLTQLTYFLQIPEGFDRRYEEMRSANNGIANGAVVAMALLYGVGAVVGLFVLLGRRRVLWRMPVICGVTVAALQALAAFNSWPLLWMNYDTSVSESSFAVQQIVATLSSAALFAVVLTLSFMAAESLSRRAFPHHAQLWNCWSRDNARSWTIVGQTAGGYLAVGVMLAYAVAFYWLTSSQFGWWSPSDTFYQPDAVATILPWLNPLAISLQAGFWEECLFRAVPLAGAALLGERFGRRRAWIAAAFVVQILVFGAAHANYPAQPAYARLVELILPSAAFGLLYLRFGLLPAIVMHFAFDAVLFSLPLFLSTASGAWIDQGLFAILFLVPAWMVLAARIRGGSWTETSLQLYNRAWQRPAAEPSESPAEVATTPQLAMPGVPVSAAIALAGLAFWAYATVRPVESPPLDIGRGEAYEISRGALADNGVDSNDWQESARVFGGTVPQHRFVWSEAGPETFRAVAGRYLGIPRWRVRYAQFEGDVAERAEEYIVWVDGHGAVEQLEHRLAESTEGALLEESAARSIARDALAGLVAASDMTEVSARSERRPARTDWYFTFRDESIGEIAGGEARAEIEIAGDEVVGTRRYVFIPEQWQRDNNQRRSTLSTVQGASGIVLWALLFAGAAAGLVRWARARFNVRALLAIGGLWLAMSVVTMANFLPVTLNGLSTAQPVPLQLGMQVALALVGAGIFTAVLGLVAGEAHSHSPGARAPGTPGAALCGAALGLGLLGAVSLTGIFAADSQPPWSDFSAASAALPWLADTIAPVQRFVVVTLVALLIVNSANAFTAYWSRRRVLVAAGVFLIGLFLAPGAAPNDLMSWWFTGMIAGLCLLVSYVWVLRAHPALVVPAAAALTIPPAVASGLEGAYSGALIGALLATVGIVYLAWRWFDRLTVRE